MYGLPDKPLNEVGVNAVFGIDLGDILQHIVLGTTTWARSYLGSSAQGGSESRRFQWNTATHVVWYCSAYCINCRSNNCTAVLFGACSQCYCGWIYTILRRQSTIISHPRIFLLHYCIIRSTYRKLQRSHVSVSHVASTFHLEHGNFHIRFWRPVRIQFLMSKWPGKKHVFGHSILASVRSS